ncbi:MAG: ABC transporter substrate-binding protein [Acetivibrionales bacterium]
MAGVENSNYILFCNPYVTYTDIEDCDIEQMKNFLELYKNEYGELPRTEIPYRAWDSMMVLWEATKLAGSNKSEDLVKVVPQIKIQGLGGMMDYSNGDGEPYHNVSRFLLLDGKNISWENWMENGGYELYKDETGNEY